MITTYTLDHDDIEQAIAEWMLRHLEVTIDRCDININPWMTCSCECECEGDDIECGVEVIVEVETIKVGDE